MHGIVIIEIYSYNKRVNALYTVLVSPSYILPKCAKTREPQDKHCVSRYTHISYNINDPIPLDNLKNHTALPYITLDRFKVCKLAFIVCSLTIPCMSMVALIDWKLGIFKRECLGGCSCVSVKKAIVCHPYNVPLITVTVCSASTTCVYCVKP